jgi:hypothetical protein
VLSPNGRRLFATGTSDGVRTGDDFITMAVTTRNGERLWTKRYDGPDRLFSFDFASDIAVSPDGSGVYVTKDR